MDNPKDPVHPTAKSHAAASAADDDKKPVEEKKTKRYSRNAKPIQTFEKRVSKSAHRVSKAVERGIQNYLDERGKSADRRKDGALIESYVNVASGISEGIAEASPALKDFAEAVNSKRTRRVLRNIVRSVPFPFPR